MMKKVVDAALVSIITIVSFPVFVIANVIYASLITGWLSRLIEESHTKKPFNWYNKKALIPSYTQFRNSLIQKLLSQNT